MGKKEVFMPNFVLTLIRTPKLPPTFASFIVPLNLNKFDIRDYLFHAYKVRVLAVRSYIQQSKIRQDKPGAIKPKARRWFRPKARKLMTVEMERPFVWPDEPEDFKAWDQKTHRLVEEYQEEAGKRMDPRQAKMEADPERESIAVQAKRILRGEDPWEARKDYVDRRIAWDDKDFEEPREVETDVVLSENKEDEKDETTGERSGL